jgi:porphobilinogen deaminase
MMTLGVLMNPWAKLVGEYAQNMLKKSLDTDIQLAFYRNDNELFDALLDGQIQVIPHSFKDLATQLRGGIVIGALAERQETAYTLVISKDKMDDTAFLKLKPNARVWVNNKLQKAQLAAFRNDFEVEQFSAYPIEAYQFLKDGLFDAILLSHYTVLQMNINLEKNEILTFNPKEFVIEAGQGVLCFLTAEDDLATRRLLKKIHQKAVSEVTNIERQVKKLFDDKDIAVYCFKDDMNNYHVWAATLVNGELKQIKLSQSTSFGIAEQCRNMLFN